MRTSMPDGSPAARAWKFGVAASLLGALLWGSLIVLLESDPVGALLGAAVAGAIWGACGAIIGAFGLFAAPAPPPDEEQASGTLSCVGRVLYLLVSGTVIGLLSITVVALIFLALFFAIEGERLASPNAPPRPPSPYLYAGLIAYVGAQAAALAGAVFGAFLGASIRRTGRRPPIAWSSALTSGLSALAGAALTYIPGLFLPFEPISIFAVPTLAGLFVSCAVGLLVSSWMRAQAATVTRDSGER